jgi:hypothetical protein
VRIVGYLVEDGKHLSRLGIESHSFGIDTHVLVACVRENNDRERCKCRNGACPLEDADRSLLIEGVTFEEVSNN